MKSVFEMPKCTTSEQENNSNNGGELVFNIGLDKCRKIGKMEEWGGNRQEQWRWCFKIINLKL